MPLPALGPEPRRRSRGCDTLVVLRPDRYLHHARPAGTWIDHLATDGSPMVGNIPAASLYHLQLAFAELSPLQPLRQTYRPA